MHARAHGFLGDDILGRGVRFDIEIRRGAGAYICGEETAIFNSIEGYRGEPRNKPPFPVQAGLFGLPTVVNNVETLANIPSIVLNGGAAFARIGTEQSTGTRALLLERQRRAARRLRSAVRQDAARSASTWPAASANGRPLQAILLGGAAGVFVGPDELDMPLTFEGARAAKATLGSGVIVAFDDTRRLREDPPADRVVLPRRVVRPVRAVPRRHGPAGRSAVPHRQRTDARRRTTRRSRCSTKSAWR